MKTLVDSESDLKNVHRSLMGLVSAIKNNKSDTSELEAELNASISTTGKYEQLSLCVNFLLLRNRKESTSMLFKTKREYLLLLVDGRGIATSLRVVGQINISIGVSGRITVKRIARDVRLDNRNGQRGRGRGRGRGRTRPRAMDRWECDQRITAIQSRPDGRHIMSIQSQLDLISELDAMPDSVDTVPDETAEVIEPVVYKKGAATTGLWADISSEGDD